MIRVLHIVGPMNPGGAETGLLRVLRCLPGTGVGFSFTAFPDEPGAMDDEVRALGGRLVPLPLWTHLVSYLRALKREFRSGCYDVVHAHHPEFAGYMLKSARQAGIKQRFLHARAAYAGAMEKGIRGLLYRALGRRRTLSATTRGIAVSATAADYVFGPRWRQDQRFTVIHNAIDLAPFERTCDRSEVREELGIPSDSLVVGHVGRFTWEKNHAKLLEVAARIIGRSPRARLLLVGDGRLRPRMEARARELGIAGKTVFTGARSDIPRMLAAMDVFAFPSLYEGLPLAVVEAQAAGVPCVLSSTMTRECIVCDDAVRVVDINAAAGDWASVVEEMAALRDPGNRAGLDAVRRTDFNADVAAARLVEEYRRAVVRTASKP